MMSDHSLALAATVRSTDRNVCATTEPRREKVTYWVTLRGGRGEALRGLFEGFDFEEEALAGWAAG